MPTKVFTPICAADQAWAENTGGTAQKPGANTEIIGGRVMATRFPLIDIPKGSTITSATVEFIVSAKTATTAQTFAYDFYFEASGPRWPINFNETLWGRNSTKEAVITGVTYNWNTAGASHQTVSVNATSAVQAMLNHADWLQFSPMTFLLYINNESDLMYVHWLDDSPARHWKLTVTYTEPASDGFARLPSIVEGASFKRITLGRWESNPAMGEFKDISSTFAVYSPDSAPVALPTSIRNANAYTESNCLRATVAPADAKSAFINHAGLTLPEGTWATLQMWVLVNGASGPDVRLETLFRKVGPWMTQKGAWVLMTHTWLCAGGAQFVGLRTKAVAAQQTYIWIYGPILTLTDYAPPWFNGSSTDTATTTYDWAVKTAIANPYTQDYGQAVMKTKFPAAAITAFPGSVAKTSAAQATFSYADPNADAQTKYQLRVNRVP